MAAGYSADRVIAPEVAEAEEARRLPRKRPTRARRPEVFDLGREERFFTAAQRRALLLRSATCEAEGCDIPGTWAEAHHWLAWADGGTTDLDNAALLCCHHHRRAHDTAYLHERLPSGDVRFTRRT